MNWYVIRGAILLGIESAPLSEDEDEDDVKIAFRIVFVSYRTVNRLLVASQQY